MFPTVEFAVFFVLTFTASWLLRPRPRAWKVFMVGASLWFYGWFQPWYTLLLCGSSLFNWAAAHAIGVSRRRDGEGPRARWILASAVAANLAALSFFKYYDFFWTSVADALGALGIRVGPPTLQVLLPVGISFFTFQAISHLVDVFRGSTEPRSLLDFTVYMSFFPRLVAGPIVRSEEFFPQLRVADPRRVRAARALSMILRGLFKKVVVSSWLATAVVDPVFGVPEAHSALDVLVAIYGYAVQIYADFSGYTDIAIGCALLLGFRLPDNFDAPYRALSVQEFWRRWHMTLSRWLRDYLYIPLGGNRVGPRRRNVNLMLTMLLGGLWHGAAWNFVLWGGIHGLALVGEREVGARWLSGRLPDRFVPVVRWLVTFHVVSLAWVFFRAEDTASAWGVLWRLVTGLGAESTIDPGVLRLALLVVAGSIALQFASGRSRLEGFLERAPWPVHAAVLAVGLVLLDVLGPEGVAPFIYFRF